MTRSGNGKVRSSKRKGVSSALSLVALYIGCLFVSAVVNRLSWLVLVLYFVASIVAFAVYAWDKSAARRGKWRTAESSLHLMGLLFGWPGALAAQRLLRHKSSKKEFLFVFWLTVFLNIAAVVYLAWLGDASVINRTMDSIWQNLNY